MKNLQQIKTANELAAEFILTNFPIESNVTQEEVKQAYINKEMKGISLAFRWFENDSLEELLFAYVEWIKIILYKADFKIFVIQIKDTYIFLKKMTYLKNDSYDAVEKLPDINMSDTDKFPWFVLQLKKEYSIRPNI